MTPLKLAIIFTITMAILFIFEVTVLAIAPEVNRKRTHQEKLEFCLMKRTNAELDSCLIFNKIDLKTLKPKVNRQ